MEIWRVGYADKRPKVLGWRNLMIALVWHVVFFSLFWVYSFVHWFFEKHEEIIPIDLTVVVNENLDGKEDEPPPLKKPDPPPKPEPPKPKPKPLPPKKPDPPKELEQMVTNIVKKVDKEKDPPKPKTPPKPQKTKEELRKERAEKMRAKAKMYNKAVKIDVANAKESGDGRTAKKTLSDAEIKKLLNEGYRPGKSEQLATSEMQFALSLIKKTFEDKWEKPPWTDTLKPMSICVWFGPGGRIVKFSLESSSGDAKADQSILSAARRVGVIPSLPKAFIDKYRTSGISIDFEVKPH